MTRPTIVAIGGHSLLDPGQPTAMDKQCAVTARTMEPVADLIASGESVILVAGEDCHV